MYKGTEYDFYSYIIAAFVVQNILVSNFLYIQWLDKTVETVQILRSTGVLDFVQCSEF
jgi:hypothetical protein